MKLRKFQMTETKAKSEFSKLELTVLYISYNDITAISNFIH